MGLKEKAVGAAVGGPAGVAVAAGMGAVKAGKKREKERQKEEKRREREARKKQKEMEKSTRAPTTTGQGASKGIAWLLFFASLLMYYFFDWQYQFNGMDIELITSNLNLLFRGSILVTAIVIFVLQYLLSTEKSEEDIISMFFVSFVFATIFVLGKYDLGVIIHLLFAAALWILLLKDMLGTRLANTWICIFVLFDFFGLTLLENLFVMVGVDPIAVAYRFIVPMYSIYLVLLLSSEQMGSKAAKWIVALLAILVVFYALGLSSTNSLYLEAKEKLTPEQQEITVEAGKNIFSKVTEGIISLFDPLRCAGYVGKTGDAYNDCIKELSLERQCVAEGYKRGSTSFQGCVKDKKESAIAIGVKDVEVEDYTKVEFEKVTQFKVEPGSTDPAQARINFDSKYKAVNIDNSCKFKKDGKEFDGVISIPGVEKGSQTIENAKGVEVYDIECRPSESYVDNKYLVEFYADVIGVNTRSVIKRIWVSDDLSENQISNVLSQNKVKEKEIKSKSDDNMAMLAISIGTGETILSNKMTKQRIVGKIQNIGEGEITNIEEVRVDIVDGVVLERDDNCNLEENEGVWKVNDEVLRRKSEVISKLKKGESTLAFSCIIDVSNLINPSHSDVRDFYSYLKYDYKITHKTSVEVI